MLINKVYRFCNENSLAIMFKFIADNITSIEVSLDNENWSPVDFEGDISDVKIFQGFQPMQVVDVYYRYLQNGCLHSSQICMVVNPENFKNNDNPNIDYSIPIDFRPKPKIGVLIPIIHAYEEGE